MPVRSVVESLLTVATRAPEKTAGLLGNASIPEIVMVILLVVPSKEVIMIVSVRVSLAVNEVTALLDVSSS